jgi:putative endopeptidase
MLGDLMTLPEKSYYENEEVLRDFTAVVEVFFKTIAVDRAAERAQWVVGLEKDFAKTFPFPKELRSLIRSKTGISRADLLKKYPNLRFNLVLSKIPASTHIRELTPANFEFLNKALEDRPLDVWKSVYLFHALRPKMDDAYPAFFQKWFDFKGKHLGGGQKRAERRERCTYEILDNFQRELDAEVLPILFSRFQSERVEKLAERIRQAMIAGITRNNWLSPEAKVEAIKKMKTAGLQLVKPKKDSEWNFGLAADYHPDRPYLTAPCGRKSITKKSLRNSVSEGIQIYG